VFSIGERSTRPLSQSTRMQAFKAETLRIPNFLDAMGNLSVSGSAQQMATNLSNHTLHACNISMSRRKAFCGAQSPTFWWTDEIAEVRRICLSARRHYQRARRRNAINWPQLHTTYCIARKKLKIFIRRSKRECFLQLCDSAECDPWGKAYKTVMKRLHANNSAAPDEPDLFIC